MKFLRVVNILPNVVNNFPIVDMKVFSGPKMDAIAPNIFSKKLSLPLSSIFSAVGTSRPFNAFSASKSSLSLRSFSAFCSSLKLFRWSLAKLSCSKVNFIKSNIFVRIVIILLLPFSDFLESLSPSFLFF